MYFSDAFQIEEISINKNDYELLKFLTIDCMCFCSKRELLRVTLCPNLTNQDTAFFDIDKKENCPDDEKGQWVKGASFCLEGDWHG